MSHPPESLDGYTLIRELGRGGMGVVYEAHDPRLGRRLALKLVLDREADAEALLRFQRESELLARISHPNVLRIHQVGTSKAGPYFVSELVEGESLDQLSRRSGALDPLEAARLVRDLASGTAALHAAGVVHRDLKPGNVVLRPDGSPVLIDFGLARDPRAQRLTVTGALLGTPHYMSPEQALGLSEVGPPSDVYALASILYALLSGGPPHEGSSTLLVLDGIVKEEVTWPAELRERVPPALIELCARAHAKAPQARPSAAELTQELEAFLANPNQATRGGRPWLWTLLVLSLTAVALAAAWGLSSPGPDPSPVARPSATLLLPSPSASPKLSISEVIASLRRPAEETFAEAQTLLEAGRGKRLPELRRRYIGARILAPPTTSIRDRNLPAYGQARWFNDQRLVVTSDLDPGLWLFSDWRSQERAHRAPPGDEQQRRSPPCVFEDRVYQGGVLAGAPLIDVYRWTSAEPERTFSSEGARVRSLAAARGPGGQPLLAVGTVSEQGAREGKILILNPESGEVLQTLRGHRPGIAAISGHDTRGGPPGIAALAFSPGGRQLASGGLAGAVILWDVETWKISTSRILNAGDIRDLSFHPSRPLLAVSTALGRRIRVLSLPELGDTPHRPTFRLGDPSHVEFSRDGRFLFACSNGTSDVLSAQDLRTGELLAYDLDYSEIVRARRFELQAPRCLELSPDGRRLAIYSRGPGQDGILDVWELDVPPK